MGDEGVHITLNEMYGELRLTHDEVREMRAELRAINDHETRLRSLERKLWIAWGAAVVFASGLGAGLAQVIPGA